MLTPVYSFGLVCGLLTGLALAFLHGWQSKRAVEALLIDGSRCTRATELPGCKARQVLLGFPVRVLLPAIGLAALVLISNGSLLAGFLGFLLGQRVAVRRMSVLARSGRGTF